MLIGDKRTPKVRRSVVVSFAAPPSPSLTCADVSGQACCKPCDGILAWMVCGAYLSWGQLLESAQLVPLMTLVNCLCLKELHFTSFQLKGLSKVHERSLQRSVSRHKKCQTLISWEVSWWDRPCSGKAARVLRTGETDAHGIKWLFWSDSCLHSYCALQLPDSHHFDSISIWDGPHLPSITQGTATVGTLQKHQSSHSRQLDIAWHSGSTLCKL